jgi:hypothetical protein
MVGQALVPFTDAERVAGRDNPLPYTQQTSTESEADWDSVY